MKDLTSRAAKLIGGIALIGAVLVAVGLLAGHEWVQLVLGMFGVVA